MRNKKGVAFGIADIVSFIFWIVTIIVFGLLFATATFCDNKAAQEVLGEDIRAINMAYQLHSLVRSPVMVEGMQLTMAEAIVLAVHKDTSSDYDLLRFNIAERLVQLAGRDCFQFRITEQKLGGSSTFKRQFGRCAIIKDREAVVIPSPAQATILVELQSGPTVKFFYLCDKGTSFAAQQRYYCKQLFGGFTCADISRGKDTTHASYDSMRECEKNEERLKQGKS